MATLVARLNQLLAVRSIRLSALVALAIAMLATLGWQTSQFIRGVNTQAPIARTENSEATNETTRVKPGSSLLSLFGAKNAEADLAAQTLEKLPESNLNLQVSAIFFMARAEQSSVILEDGDRTLMLKGGEEARPGIVVQNIESHRITLKRNGKLEQISFKGYGEMPGAAPATTSEPAAAQVSAALPDIQPDNTDMVAQAPVEIPPAPPAAVEQNSPTAYQQYIQRKLAQAK